MIISPLLLCLVVEYGERFHRTAIRIIRKRDMQLLKKENSYMASTIIAHLFNDIEIGQRSHDGYIDATAMCKASNKLLADYLRLKSTNEYFEALSLDMGIPISALVMVSRGGNGDQRTYVNPEIAVDLGKWCCVQLRILVNRWIVEWSTKSAQPQPTLTQQWLWHVRMQQFVNTNAIPQGYWCVYLELTKMVALMEGQGVVLHDYAVPDISVGLCWSKYLKDNGINSEHKFYSHSYPDTRGSQDARIYPHKLLGVFHEWLETIYRAEKFPKYIRERCSNDDLHKISLLFGVAIKPKQLRAAKR